MTGILPHDALALGIGAFLGAMSRYQAGRLFAEYIASDPKLSRYQGWHTAAINVGGSFMLGGVAGAPVAPKANCSLSPRSKLLLGVGFCGSFTTFSTFSVDVATWLSNGQTSKALSYVLVNNVGGVCAAAAGLAIIKKLVG